jgi:Restriction endonuclease
MAKRTVPTAAIDPAQFEADVALILQMAGFQVRLENVAYDAMIDIVAEREERGALKRYAIECKASPVSAAVAHAVLRKFEAHNDPTIHEFWLVSSTVSSSALEAFRKKAPRYRCFSLDALEASVSPKSSWKANARTKVGRSVENNFSQIVLAVAALTVQIDDRLIALRAERPNSTEATAARDSAIRDYERLREQLEELRKSITAFKAGRTTEPAVVKNASTFADGVRRWWSKSHEKICDKALDTGLFLSAVTICSLAGAGGNMAVVASAFAPVGLICR